MEEIFFIDKDGNKLHSDNLSSHLGLAKLIVENDEKLKADFEKSGKRDMSDFLVVDKGYIKVSNMERYKQIVYFGSKLSPKQAQYIPYFYEYGFAMEDMNRLELNDEQYK